ncbi:MAG TPA: methyltransferase domain-containing protein [Gaiellaceae bacterium]|nr:methyltransferase domain-containing protein [Gaiellaceae bacterium]
MKCCQTQAGYGEFFSEAQARRDARRFRRKGLDGAARWVVEAVSERGVEGRSVLEPGGGVGAIEIELLRAGAARSTIVELSPGYEQVASELSEEAGVAERLEWRVGDFAANGTEPADVVVLHRVVCCYPDYERLLGAATEKARQTIVFTYPPRNLVSRALLGAINLWLRLRGTDFRTFAHPPERMAAVVREAGFEPYATRRGGIWRGAAFARRR